MLYNICQTPSKVQGSAALIQVPEIQNSDLEVFLISDLAIRNTFGPKHLM